MHLRLLTAKGEAVAFEIEAIGRRRLVRIVQTIPGAHVIRAPRLFSWLREIEFCEFDVGGVRFVSFEPFGDNDRYWVGPKNTEEKVAHPQFDMVRNAFQRA